MLTMMAKDDAAAAAKYGFVEDPIVSCMRECMDAGDSSSLSSCWKQCDFPALHLRELQCPQENDLVD